jgi:hypothetical protein
MCVQWSGHDVLLYHKVSSTLPSANMPVGEPGGPDSEMFYDFELTRALSITAARSSASIRSSAAECLGIMARKSGNRPSMVCDQNRYSSIENDMSPMSWRFALPAAIP